MVEKKPEDELFQLLRRLYVLTLEKIHDDERKKEIKESFLSYSLDIASSCVTKYPYDINERFDPQEKKCFFSLLNDIGVLKF